MARRIALLPQRQILTAADDENLLRVLRAVLIGIFVSKPLTS